MEILRGTYVKDEAGSFNGIVECFGKDSSGRVMILVRPRQFDEVSKII
ncbi:MAG: hypothetical protein QXU09_03650 [Thermoproteota archaeon]